MKKIYDKQKIAAAVSGCIYSDMLCSLNVPVFLVEYKAGESISSPINSDPLFQIVLKGSLLIYFIRDDGSTYSLSSGGEGYILGEMDLFTDSRDSVFAEASDTLLTIAIDTKLYKEELLVNIVFLRFISSVMASKIAAIMNQDAVYSTLPDRVMNYMRYKCDDMTLIGIEKAAFRLHCSPRQLQRIMNSFVENDLALKTGKGSYKLL